ncbi:MAG TPA: MarR family transcriptional regulator [Flavisolibacter sp.]|nr:MarR family transcriptional regulator [Flavisolibacter sp.]
MNVTGSKYGQCLYFTSAALARKVDKLAQASWKQVDLSPSHGYLLLSILEEPGMQPTALAEQLQLQPSTITRLIEKLEEKKLVIRTTEGKLTNVYPTPRAKDLLPRMKACIEEFSGHYMKLLGAKESAAIVQQIANLTDKL